MFLMPLLLACFYVAFSGESAAVAALFSVSYAVYFLLWTVVVTACSALFEKSSASFTILIIIWMSACVLLPRLGSSVATNLVPSMGKLEADFKVEEKLRSLGDGHDVNDPAFKKLKQDLLAKYNVDSVDDLPVNFRGVVAQYSEQRQAEVLSEFAENRMQQELEQAAQQAGALEFINTLPSGFDTLIGEQGEGLSGGQKQRIALARAFLKNAPILMLDEPTAHLDSQTEQHIQHAINTVSYTHLTLPTIYSV